MRYLRLVFVAFLGCVLAVSFCYSQDETGLYHGKVYVSGDNPVLRLKLQETDKDFVTSVSFWRIVYSPAGRGHICYIKSDITGDGESADDVRAIYTDNEGLVEYMNREILPRYLKDPYPVYKAHFAGTGDPLKEWVEVIQSEKNTIFLVWKDFITPFLIATRMGSADNPFGLTSLCIPATTAEVYVNGKKAVGRPFPEMRGKAQNSTARLWWGETWVK
ncbi:MAG: hypothetical protein A2W25_11520 [candidate division Zixibacteria bacterium RBG_16_53_22]|nr:MAG: hypothetical protein A2W25_11520 [candidate division Zixibacteria bacterium RBG_16_53_22]